MDKETRASLLKHFSLILKFRSRDDKYQKLTPPLGQYYARKDLIEILKKKHEGSLPPDLNLMECENKELLTLIGDDMYLISHTTEMWAMEKPIVPPKLSHTALETDPSLQGNTSQNIKGEDAVEIKKNEKPINSNPSKK